MKQNILLLDADGTQGLIIAESLCKAEYIVHSFCYERYSYGFHTRYVKNKIIAPSVKKENEYLFFLTDYIKKNAIDVLLPMTDDSAEIISKNKTDLSKIVKFIMPDYDIFTRGYNKKELMTVCEKHHFPHPKTIDLNIVSPFELEKFSFPAMLKPNYTTGGRGMSKINSFEELNKVLSPTIEQYGDCHLQEFIGEGGKQYKVQLFVDEKYNLIQSSVIYKQRYYPVKAGSSCCNVTVENKELVTLCYCILKTIHWQGFADFDLIEDPKDGIIKVMEINPRIPACIKSTVKSGIDWGNLIVDETLGNQCKNYTYIAGKRLRHIGFEVLWFFYSKNRFKTNPNWFNFFDRNLSFQDFSWKDPLPFFFGTIGNIKKQLNPRFRKSKSGTKK